MDVIIAKIAQLKSEQKLILACLAVKGHEQRTEHVKAMIEKGLLPASWMS